MPILATVWRPECRGYVGLVAEMTLARAGDAQTRTARCEWVRRRP